MHLRRTALILATPLVLAAVACAPVDDKSSTSASDSADSSSSASSPAADACSPDQMQTRTPGTLTVGTDSPAYDPWFNDNDPTNGKGYESAVAYAVAEQLGYTQDQVTWVKVPFNSSYKPGPKDFDFDINQISITPARAKVVDFSDGYYAASQAVIALKASPAADATSLADLKDLKLGAQTGTTSLTAIRDVIQPSSDPLVFEDTNAANHLATARAYIVYREQHATLRALYEILCTSASEHPLCAQVAANTLEVYGAFED